MLQFTTEPKTLFVKETTDDYSSFVAELTGLVKERMGDQFSVRIYKVTKNNSLELDSMVLLKEGKNFAPNIYLQPYYESFLQGTTTIELADRLCGIYNQCNMPIVKENFSYSFDDMKAFVIYRLVSYERNKKLLAQIPHKKYLDLAITFHCLVRDDEEGIGTIRITNDHMKLWNTNLEELYSLAIANTGRLFPSSIRSMEEVIRGMFASELMQLEQATLSDDILNQLLGSEQAVGQHKMYILTNQKGINGASCLLYENVLSTFADQINTDFYILPSSIHEIILVPHDKTMSMASLTEMVKDVNHAQVAEDEVLSDRVYYYSRINNAISM